MATRLGWIHFSDLHLGSRAQKPLWPNVREALFADLERLHERSGPWQLVFFTGDLAQSGDPKEFLEVDALLGRIWQRLEELGSPGALLLPIPGNHDLQRPPRTRAALRLLALPGGWEAVQEEFWEDPDSEYRRLVVESLANYETWRLACPLVPSARFTRGLLPGDFSFTLAIDGLSIGVVGLNSTFLQLSGGDYRERLALDVRQLEATCGDIGDWVHSHPVRLLLTHQGPEWLSRANQSSYSEINPAGRFLTHLFGHMHETILKATSLAGGPLLRLWQVPSLFGLEKFGDPPVIDRKHGYAAGEITASGTQTSIRFWPRRAIRDSNGWRFVPDHESGLLGPDEATPNQILGDNSPTRPRASRNHLPLRKTSHRSPNAAELAARYAAAARALWDIIDLAGLPEDDRHLAMQRFVVRQLFVPLTLSIDSNADVTTGSSNRVAVVQSATEDTKDSATPSSELSLGDWLSQEVTSVTGEEARAPRLILLGDPGGGKTTLLRWLATAYLLRFQGDPDLERLPAVESLPVLKWLPVLVRCRDLEPNKVGQAALDYLLRQTIAKMELESHDINPLLQLLRTMLAAGDAILLVDGLDEIADIRLRAAFCARLESIATRFKKAPILATSRIVGYREMNRRFGQGFTQARLGELSSESKDEFVARWCEVTVADPGRRDAEVERLRSAIHATDRIERLTTNPMLLTTMALVQRKVGKLPTRRHKLYWEAVNVLLNWRSEVDEPLDPDEALPQLEYIAYAMCQQGVQRLRRDQVMELLDGVRRDYGNIRPIRRLDPEVFLGELERRTALLVAVGETPFEGRPVPVYEFRHLTFQEYLAALALIKGRFPGHRAGTTLAQRVRPLASTLAEKSTPSGSVEVVVSESWREPLRLCVASCNDDDVDPVLDAILIADEPSESRPRALLALSCLADEPNVGADMAKRIVATFAHEVTLGDGSGRPRTGADKAAIEVAGSGWRTALLAGLMREFHESAAREPVGGLAAMMAAGEIPPDATARAAWMRAQVKKMANRDPLIACEGALFVLQAAYTAQAVPVGRLVDGLLALSAGTPADLHASVWSLAWLTSNCFAADGAWSKHRARFREAYEARLLPLIEAGKAEEIVVGWLLRMAQDLRVIAALEPAITLIGANSPVRWEAIETLGRLGGERALTVLADLAQKGVEDVKSSIVRALNMIEAPGDGSAAKGLLVHSDAGIRRAAVGILVRSRGSQREATLMSKDFDGVGPWIDPTEPVDNSRLAAALAAVGSTRSRIMGDYRRFGEYYGLVLRFSRD